MIDKNYIRPLDVNTLLGNAAKARKQLSWKPKINILNGLIKTFDWYLKNPGYYLTLKKRDITARLGNKFK